MKTPEEIKTKKEKLAEWKNIKLTNTSSFSCIPVVDSPLTDISASSSLEVMEYPDFVAGKSIICAG